MSRRSSPVAIIGSGCALPGALSPHDFAELVLAGRDVVTATDPAEWGISRALADPGHPMGATEHFTTPRGGRVVDFAAHFDPEPFLRSGLPSAVVESTVGWLLHSTRQALAGVAEPWRDPARTAVIIGNLAYPSRSYTDYSAAVLLGAPEGVCDRKRNVWGRFCAGGPALWVAQAYGLTGSAFCLDAACASSLYALALATSRLAEGRIDSALVGGLAMVDGLFIHMGFTALKAISPTGRSRPFHRQADGLLPAEGAAVVLLKRLNDALDAGDPILGVIESVGLSNDGAAGGLLAPDGPGQIRAMHDAFARTALTPSDIDLIECHATGTPLGDPLELRSTAAVYGEGSGLPLGSIKSNLGHLTTASGLAGLLKIIAGFTAEQKPPTLHCSDPLPEIADLGFRLLQQSEPWPAGRARHAAITNLGFGGNNAHLIVSAPSDVRQLSPAEMPETPPVEIALVAAFGRGDGLSAGQGLADSWASDEAGSPADHVEIALHGLKFPPTDLRKSLGQQTLMLASGQSAALGGGDKRGAIIGMSTDATICRYPLRWRLPDLLASYGLRYKEGVAQADVLSAIMQPLESAHVLGAMPNMPANRLSVQFDYRGPSFTVAAEELSGLAALEVASDLLRRGNLETALVGAVDLSRNALHQAAQQDAGLEEGGSPANHAIALILKSRLEAEADGDAILAVIGEPTPAETISSVATFERRFGRAHAAAALGNVALAATALAQRADPAGDRLVPRFRRDTVTSISATAFTGATRTVSLRAVNDAMPLLRTERKPIVLRLLSRPNPDVPFTQILDRASMADPSWRERLAVVADSEDEADRLQAEAIQALAEGRRLPISRDVWHANEPIGGELALIFGGAAAGRNWRDPGWFALYPELIDKLCAVEPEIAADIYHDHIAPGLPDDNPFVHLKISTLVSQAHARLAIDLLKVESHATLGLSSGETNSLIAFGFTDGLSSLFDEIKGSDMYGGWLSGECRSAAVHWGRDEPVEWVCWQVMASRELLEPLLEAEPLISLTIINAPGVFSICGEAAAMARLLKRLEGHTAQRLHSDLVVHSTAMTPFAEQWRRIHSFPIRPQNVRLYGNAFNAAYTPTTEHVADALTRQALDTVDFPATVERAWSDGVRVFIECGPRAALSAAVRHTLGDRPHLAMSFDQAGVSPDRQVARIAAALFTAGHGFDHSLFARARRPSGPTLTLPLQLPEIDTRHFFGDAMPGIPASGFNTVGPRPLFGGGVFAQVPLPEPVGPPLSVKLAGGGLLQVDRELPPSGLQIDRAGLEVCARGKLSEVFGPLFASQDGYVRQVRMPCPPLLLADRVTGLAGEAGSLGNGIVWTETDVPADAWYLCAGRMPPGIAIESGQADLLLISWMGADFLNKNERVYRLLGCELVFHGGGMPRPGETLRYQIHVDGHAQLGGVRLFFFHYDCRIGDRLLMSVRNGQAGFFSNAELAQARGVIWSPEDHAPAADVRLDPPPCASVKRSFSAEDITAFSEGHAFAAFGAGFEMAAAHQRTPGIPCGNMKLIDDVPLFDPAGGPWGRGYLQARTRVPADAWFYEGHFHNDPCMPGTLMADAATQALAVYMAGCGLTISRDGWRFEPVPETPFRFVCRGQVIPDAPHQLLYEVFVEEFIAGPQPTVFASLLCSSDGMKVFHCPRFGLRLVPDWPLDERRTSVIPADKPHTVRPDGDVRGDFGAMMACAWGAPSEAFGSRHASFDDGSARIPRLPGPPYHLLSRIESVDCPPHVPTVGGRLVSAYDVPANGWYFADNATDVMPFSVLLEVLLQPCGWLATYMGFALEGNLYFRNLDGVECRALRPVRPDSGTLRVEVIFTDYSKMGSLTLVKYRVSCSDDLGAVMQLETGFGFFPGASLSNQKGLPVLPAHRDLIEAPATHDLPYADLGALPGAKLTRLAAGALRMVDRITGFWPTGGSAGIGRIRGHQDIDPEAWYFKAHFFQDPVQPGSLGLEALIQLLTAATILKGLDRTFADPQLEALAKDQPLIWKYRGQVLPRDRTVTTHLDLTAIVSLPDGSLQVVADGSLWVGSLRIYEVQGLSLRLWDRSA